MFSFSLWELWSPWFYQEESTPVFHFPGFVLLILVAISILYIYPPIPYPAQNKEKVMIDHQSISLQNSDYSTTLFQLSVSTSGRWGQNNLSHQATSVASLSLLDYHHLLKFKAKLIFFFPCLVAACEFSFVLFLTFVFLLFTTFSFLCYLYQGVAVLGVFSMRHRLPWNAVTPFSLKPVPRQLRDRL